MGGLAKLAQKYPTALCRAMIKGAEVDNNQKPAEAWATVEESMPGESRDLEDLLEDAVNQAGGVPSGIQDASQVPRDEVGMEEPHEEEDEGHPDGHQCCDAQHLIIFHLGRSID